MILGVIPARSQSKRVKDKNIRLVHGKPLIYYTIREAKLSSYLDKIVVSTDSELYADVVRLYDVEVIMRPSELCMDDSPTYVALQHAVSEIEKENHEVTLIVTLQPTSPMRLVTDINKAIHSLVSMSTDFFDSCATVCEVSERPEWMFKRGKFDRLEPIMKANTNVEGYKLPKIYKLNGAVYCTRRKTLMNDNTVVGDSCRAIIMPIERSLDIDTEQDFEYLEYYWRNKLEVE